MSGKSPEQSMSGAKATPDALARKRFGASGERLNVHWLEQHGYRIRARNRHCAYGELDIVTEQGEYLVFVEV